MPLSPQPVREQPAEFEPLRWFERYHAHEASKAKDASDVSGYEWHAMELRQVHLKLAKNGRSPAYWLPTDETKN